MKTYVLIDWDIVQGYTDEEVVAVAKDKQKLIDFVNKKGFEGEWNKDSTIFRRQTSNPDFKRGFQISETEEI